MNAHEIRAVIESPLQYGWKEGKFGLGPVLFEGQMSSDFLQDLVCTYAKGNQCAVGVVCVSNRICLVLNSVHAKRQISVVISIHTREI